jgi:YidC/Oxa1 family membrane protein insertase
MDSQRFLLLLALGLILFLILQAWQEEHRPPAPPPSANVPAGPTSSQAPQPKVAEAPAPPPVVATTSEAAPTPGGARVEVTTDVLDVAIDTAGGDLRELKLLAYPVSVDQPRNPFALFRDQPPEQYYTGQSGLIGTGRYYPNHKTLYQVDQPRYRLAAGQDELRVPLHWQAPDGVRYTLIYVFHRNSYVIDIEYLVENGSAAAWQGYLYRQFRHHYVEPKRGWFSLPTYTGGAIYTPEEKYQKISFPTMREHPLKRDVTGGWVAMLEHYFVAAWMPGNNERNRFYSTALTDDDYAFGLKQLEPTTVAAGQSARLQARLYAGPKLHKRLRALAPGMELTVDFGWLTFIASPLFWLLQYIHSWIGNWGWSIIVLTLLIKLVFYPLSATSYKSMAHMKRVQPKLQSLRERLGHDRQRLNQAMMELYKKERINPLGGCLPIAIQIPVFISLYWVLLESVELRQAPFILWIRDLSAPDPYFVLPIIMGISMFLQQRLTPTQMDPMQQKIMSVLPVLFTSFFLFFPAGLVLYWTVNNILSIAQQWHITRVIAARAK